MVLPSWFDGFLDLAADRHGVLMAALADSGVAARSVELAGGRFIIAWPRGSRRESLYRMKVLTAHHDRVPGTPGALDNSAACLQLWDFLRRERPCVNTVAIFTDREELSGGQATEQGSYALGQALAGLGLKAPLVYPLDVTGRGDCLVLSTSGSSFCSSARGGERPGIRADARGGERNGELVGGERNAEKGAERGHAAETLARLGADIEAMADTALRLMSGRSRVYRMAVPFGEDLGFILAGVPALTVTVLPRAEADSLAGGNASLPAWASLEQPGRRSPDTWSRLHGPGDTPGLYTPEAFEAVSRLLSRLADLRVPASVG